MEKSDVASTGIRTIVRQLAAVAVLVACALLIAGAFSHSPKPFSSVEVKFTDASAHGLAIVPASCPSNPFDADAPNGCSGNTPLCPDGSAAPGGSAANCPSIPSTPPNNPGGNCPSGSTPSGSLCITSCSFSPGIGIPPTCNCPGGFTAQNGVCVAAQCPTGYTLEGGSCVFTGCPANYLLQNGQCVLRGQCTPQYICSGSTLEFQDASCTVTPTQQCSFGCSGGACNPPPASTLNIQAVPSIVKSGETTQVSWRAGNVTSCNIIGTDGEHWNCSGASCDATTTETTTAIIAQTTFTLSCAALDGSSPNKSVTVTIVPKFIEH